MFHFEMPLRLPQRGLGPCQQAFSQSARYLDRCILHNFLRDGSFGYGPKRYRHPNVCPGQD